MIYGAFLSIKYLKKLEIKTGRYHNYPNEDLPHEDTEIKEEDYEFEKITERKRLDTHCPHTRGLSSDVRLVRIGQPCSLPQYTRWSLAASFSLSDRERSRADN